MVDDPLDRAREASLALRWLLFENAMRGMAMAARGGGAVVLPLSVL